MPPVMSSVFGGSAEAGKLRGFLEGHGSPGLWNALDLFGEFEIDVAVEQDVDFVVKISGANVFVAEIGVGNFALVEGVTEPADGVCVGPGNPDADARRGSEMMRGRWEMRRQKRNRGRVARRCRGERRVSRVDWREARSRRDIRLHRR